VDFQGVTFVGPPVDDHEMFDRLPPDLQRFLEQANGLVAYYGGLHIRGACGEPAWHSLRVAWAGPNALHERYPAVGSEDVPFAQDAVGDQWLLRAGKVVRLLAETGDLEETGMSFAEFLAAAAQTPIDTLGLQPLMQLQTEGGRLEPGQLLNVYPPFCTEEAASGVSLRAVPAGEQLAFLADLAAQLPATGRFRIKAGD
jgi:hypothetical protein